jgi:hypothetical protein
MVIEIVLYLLLLATSLPVGLFLAWLCDDELIKDRKYFSLFSYFLLLITILLFFFYFKISLILALVYLIFILGILIRRGKIIEKNLSRRKLRKN